MWFILAPNYRLKRKYNLARLLCCLESLSLSLFQSSIPLLLMVWVCVCVPVLRPVVSHLLDALKDYRSWIEKTKRKWVKGLKFHFNSNWIVSQLCECEMVVCCVCPLFLFCHTLFLCTFIPSFLTWLASDLEFGKISFPVHFLFSFLSRYLLQFNVAPLLRAVLPHPGCSHDNFPFLLLLLFLLSFLPTSHFAPSFPADSLLPLFDPCLC